MVSSPSLRKKVMCRLEFEAVHALGLSIGAILRNGMRAYWYRDVVNFGDMITPLLLRHFGYTPIYDRPFRAQLVGVGSVLEHLQDDFCGTILGSGFIDEKSKRDFPNAKVLGVRGCLTKDRIGGRHKNVALGDPGLLASSVMPARASKEFALGIVLHHSNSDSILFSNLVNRLRPGISMIDVRQAPLVVFRQIDQCEHILSSSLHGLIVADSLNIPNGWLSSGSLIGGRFKFDDYYSSLRVRCNPVTLHGEETLSQLIALTTRKPVERVEEVKHEIEELWSSVGLRVKQFRNDNIH